MDAALQKAGIAPPQLPRPTGFRVDLLTLPQRFHVETRIESWASAVEQQLAPVIARDLRTIAPDVSGVKLECRTFICRLGLRSPTAQRVLIAFVKQVYGAESTAALPDVYLPVHDGKGGRVPADNVARLLSRRAANLYALRTGRLQPAPELAVAKLPKE